MHDDPTIDLSDYRQRRPSVLPGTYRVQIEDTEVTVSSLMHPMVNVWFNILDGDHSGLTVTDRIVISGASTRRAEAFRKAVDLPLREDALESDARALIGRVLEIEVANGESYNGRVRSRVSGYARQDPAR